MPSLTMLRESDSATDEEMDEPTARSTAFLTSSFVSPPPPWARATPGKASSSTASTIHPIELTRIASSPSVRPPEATAVRPDLVQSVISGTGLARLSRNGGDAGTWHSRQGRRHDGAPGVAGVARTSHRGARPVRPPRSDEEVGHGEADVGERQRRDHLAGVVTRD